MKVSSCFPDERVSFGESAAVEKGPVPGCSSCVYPQGSQMISISIQTHQNNQQVRGGTYKYQSIRPSLTCNTGNPFASLCSTHSTGIMMDSSGCFPSLLGAGRVSPRLSLTASRASKCYKTKNISLISRWRLFFWCWDRGTMRKQMPFGKIWAMNSYDPTARRLRPNKWLSHKWLWSVRLLAFMHLNLAPALHAQKKAASGQVDWSLYECDVLIALQTTMTNLTIFFLAGPTRREWGSLNLYMVMMGIHSLIPY